MVSDKKLQGQYFTPSKVVDILLDGIGYKGTEVLTKSIIEPSFGDGAFLTAIVQRIITEGKNNGMLNKQIADIINEKVFGIEKDVALYNKTIERLNTLLNDYDIPVLPWNNLICGDTLLEYEKFLNSKDYCVGNPPFLRIHNISQEYRNAAKNFRFANGMLDLYIIFYEIGLCMLNEKGKLGYVSPNSFMKNLSQRDFRNFLLDNKYLDAIYDFKESKLFEDTDIHTCICLLNKDRERTFFSVKYREYQMYKLVAERYLNYNDFSTDPTDNVWIFSSPSDIEFLQKNEKLPNKVGSMAIVQNGIVTNKDVLYIVKVFNDKNLTIPYYGKHTDKQKIVYFEYNGNVSDIESTILHRCVKESKYNGMIDNTYIIFPYKTKQSTRFFLPNNTLIESGYEPLSEEEIKKEFPLAYNYLLAIYDKLSVRDMDKNIAWFLYGRTQGLANSCFKKIVFKHIVKKKTPLIVPYILDDDVIVYSGMYTTIAPDLCISPKSKSNNNDYIFNDKKYDFLLRKVYDIFSSPEFARYCSLRGKDKLGGYVELSTKMVKSFGISPTTLKTPKISVDISQIKIPIVDFKKNIPDYPDL